MCVCVCSVHTRYGEIVTNICLSHISALVLALTQSSYTQNGILNMVDRNRRIKQHPERFQECTEQFDLVVTVEERVYDQVVECE